MNKLLIIFLLYAQFIFPQELERCKARFDHYLNYNGNLNRFVRFAENNIQILDASGKPELKIYEHEIPTLAFFFINSSREAQEQLIRKKGTKPFTNRQLDSLFIFTDDRKSLPESTAENPLHGYRIAIDPGHFAVELKEADTEQKYLCFVKDSLLHPLDSVKLFESALTFNTAVLLKKMLEADGAEVMLSRDQANFTSFNCTYTDWKILHKKKCLDSLYISGRLTAAQHKQILKYNEKKFFWEFFRDYDLNNRVRKINAFQPHLSVVIHYNVDEKNEPWKQCTNKDFTMTFIGGVFTTDVFSKPDVKLDFLRLLLSDQLDQSQQLAEETVNNFHKNLEIPIAGREDATYLKESCLSGSAPGVFARNLMLCRKINSPLVYGEALYQDNVFEAEALMKNDLEIEGITTNQRLLWVARSYYVALKNFAASRLK